MLDFLGGSNWVQLYTTGFFRTILGVDPFRKYGFSLRFSTIPFVEFLKKTPKGEQRQVFPPVNEHSNGKSTVLKMLFWIRWIFGCDGSLL